MGTPGVTVIRCKGPGCKKKTKYRSKEWNREWMMVWIESKNKSFHVCSHECADALKERHAKDTAV
jgi:hypothetical protein